MRSAPLRIMTIMLTKITMTIMIMTEVYDNSDNSNYKIMIIYSDNNGNNNNNNYMITI